MNVLSRSRSRKFRLTVEKIRIANSNVTGKTKYILLSPSSNVGPGSSICIAQGSSVTTTAILIDSLQRWDIGVSQKTFKAKGIVMESRGAHIMKPWIGFVVIWVGRRPVIEDSKSRK